MDSKQIEQLAKKGIFSGRPLNGKLIETHISWVILGEMYTFKIKKPMHYAFLDFRTQEKRKYYCEREVELNLRLSDIYLDVLPIKQLDDTFNIGGDTGSVMDYAVRMRTMDNDRKMDCMLRKNQVGEKEIAMLANRILDFHRDAQIIHQPFDQKKAREDFNDLVSVSQWVNDHIGPAYFAIIEEAIEFSDDFLGKHSALIQKRIEESFRRDVHGDLHSKNIFLYPKHPIIFDCIEFNDDMRRVDLVNEIAFFCMDLEVYARYDLSNEFLNTYLASWKIIRNDEEWLLFTYYKAYRANVRAKVNALRAMQTDDLEYKAKCADDCRAYLDLMNHYINTNE